MTKRIAIVTDSTADLPPQRAQELGITIIPLTINFGLAFKAVYEKLLAEYDSIISIHISSGLSGTINAALTAKEMVAGEIHVVDSKSVSLGIGLIVLEAREMVEQGLAANEIVAQLDRVCQNTEVLFTLDTLEYLHKGGRIGKVAAVMGSLLNIKPIVRVVDGIYIPAGKARRQEQALQEIVNQFENLARGRKIKRLVVAHGAAEPAAARLANKLYQVLNQEPEMLMAVGPVIGVHTGPGTVGAAMLLN